MRTSVSGAGYPTSSNRPLAEVRIARIDALKLTIDNLPNSDPADATARAALPLAGEDGGDDLQFAAAVRAVLEVELEHPLEQPRPTQPHRAVVRTVRLALCGLRCLGTFVQPLRHHQRAHLGVRCQHAMESNQVQPWPWHQGCKPLHELQRRHHQVRGAVAPGCLQLQHHLPCCVALHALIGQRRAGDVAAQLLERLALVGAAAHSRVQAEPVDVGAEVLLEVRLPRHDTLDRQHLLAGAWSEGDAVSTRRGLQWPERAGFVRIVIVVGFLTGLGVGRYGVLALIMLMYLVLGCLMDAMAMIILTVPIIFPVVTALGFDPIWFGVIIVMTVELGLIHPPVGMNVFVIKSVVKDVSFTTIFKGVLPFVATDLVRLVILIAFPIIALWLPARM